MNYLLDSSALLAFYFGESGGDRVQEILSDEKTVVRLSVLSMAEFWSRLRAIGSATLFNGEWRQLSEMMTSIDPISSEIVYRSTRSPRCGDGTPATDRRAYRSDSRRSKCYPRSPRSTLPVRSQSYAPARSTSGKELTYTCGESRMAISPLPKTPLFLARPGGWQVYNCPAADFLPQ